MSWLSNLLTMRLSDTELDIYCEALRKTNRTHFPDSVSTSLCSYPLVM
jgi:hypothetical protein